MPAGDSHLDGSTLSALADAGAVSADWLLLLCLWRGRQGSADDPLQKLCYFMIVAILLTFVHECKPDSRQPLAEVGISHGHLRCSRPSGRNKDAFGRNDSIPIITSYIDLGRVSFSFAFFNMAKEPTKLCQCREAKVTDLISKGFRRDVLLGVDDCREIIELTAEGYK